MSKICSHQIGKREKEKISNVRNGVGQGELGLNGRVVVVAGRVGARSGWFGVADDLREEPDEFRSQVVIEPAVEDGIETGRAHAGQVADGVDGQLEFLVAGQDVEESVEEIEQVERDPAQGERQGDGRQELVGLGSVEARPAVGALKATPQTGANGSVGEDNDDGRDEELKQGAGHRVNESRWRRFRPLFHAKFDRRHAQQLLI